jgi:hypothetical protein
MRGENKGRKEKKEKIRDNGIMDILPFLSSMSSCFSKFLTKEL